MKVLLTQKIAGIAGSEKYYFKLLKGLKNKGVDYTFLAIITEKDKLKAQKFTKEIENLNIKCDKIFIKKNYSLNIFSKLKNYINKNNFDLVHSNLIHCDLWFAIIKPLVKKKYKLLTVKHGYTEKYLTNYGFTSGKIPYDAFWFACFIAEKFVDYSIAKSNGIKDLYVKLKICNPEKTETIYHGFELKEVDYKKSKSKIILILGRLSHSKGLEEALDAFKIVLQKHQDYKLQLVGSGPLKNDLQEKCKKLEIENNVEFVGFVNNVNEYLRNATIKLMPTKGEGFGLVFLEAIENKIPIVAFDVPAGNEILKNNETAFLVEPFNATKLSNKIIALIENESLRKTFTENAFEDAKKRFTLEEMLDKTLEVYEKVLNA